MENFTTEQSQLYEAVKNRNLQRIQTIIEQECNLQKWAYEVYDDQFDGFLNTVQKAVHLRDKRIIGILLQAISNPKIRDEYIFMSLDVAAILGEVDIFQHLVNSLSSNFSKRDLSYVLNHAIWGGSEKIVSILIDLGIHINIIFEWGETPLMAASRKGDIDLVKLIVEAGANVNIINEESPFTGALGLAAINGHQDIYDYLCPLVSNEEEQEFAYNTISGIIKE
ncbi:hypothetical protein BI308_19200 [Roseofilum reptotaenium AO1-A]|uniref:Uncharacterized protein n=2 Tax=Roseofilum TaxID=1233426 RepID=A0A1L9QML1_9CYAN|nr:hypothetical protein BI308_19200 [Roseofilum reptotaenium AO1-A]